nr:hypothetical protein [Tanacetum cinerariifolium]
MDVEEINTIVEEEGETWMTPIINCLERRVWPEDQNEVCALRMKINQYIMEEGVLFKRSYLMPMLRDAREEIRKCDSCQIHSPILKLLKILMTLIMAPLPFFQWGMDVLGPLPEATGKVRFIIVAVDYFTKWIEAKPLAKTTGQEVKKFIWDNTVCQYRLPKIIVTDNRTNFIHDPFKSWCKKLNITQINTVVAHPQANGLMERENRSLMEGIKTRLWRERKEIDMPTHRTMMIKEGNGNEEEMRLNLDLLTERREAVAIREARYKMKIEQYYNKRVRLMSFKVGEYVYRKNEASRVENLGNLGPK